MSEAKHTAPPYAVISYLPTHYGDGYSWGGGIIMTIGSSSLQGGNSKVDQETVLEIAKRFNSYTDLLVIRDAAAALRDYESAFGDADTAHQASLRATLDAALAASKGGA